MEAEQNATMVTIEELDRAERLKHIPLVVVLVTLMLVGIFGNLLVLVIYKTKFKRSSARCYILSLALTDLCVCLVGIPYHVIDLTLILTYTNTTLCRLLSFLIGSCTLSSVFILLVVGLDRFFKVCRPLKRQIIDFGDRKACLIAVIIAVVISIPNGIIYGHSTVVTGEQNLTGVECFIDDEYQASGLAVSYLGFNMLVFVLAVIYLIVIYGFICRKIYQHNKEITLTKTKKICFCCSVENQDEDDAEDENAASNVNTIKNGPDGKPLEVKKKAPICKPEKKAAKPTSTMIRHTKPGSKAEEKHTRKITLMMMTITVVFIIAYLPFIIISILDSVDDDFWKTLTYTESLLTDLLLRLYLINNVANPIIYSFWDNRFRREASILLKKMICCMKQPNRSTQFMNKNTQAFSSCGAYSKYTEAVTLQ